MACAGEFGAVYRGALNDWKDYTHHTVAVKTLKGIAKRLVTTLKVGSTFIFTLLSKRYPVLVI